MPARATIRGRLDELLAIGAISVPTPARGRYFYQRRDGRQNQPVLYVREGVDGEDRVAVDPNALDAAGTTALDWYYPERRRPAAGLRTVRERQRAERAARAGRRTGGTLLPTGFRAPAPPISPGCPTERASTTPAIPRPGEVPEGEEHYHRAIYFHRLGTDPAADPLVYRPAREGVLAGRERLARRPLAARRGRPHVRPDRSLPRATSPRAGRRWCPWPKELPASFDGEVAHGRLFLRTNLDAPTYRLYVVNPEQPDARALARDRAATGGRGARRRARSTATGSRSSYLERASSRLRLTDLDGGLRPRGRAADARAACSASAASGTATSCSSASRRTPCRRASTGSISATRRADALAAGRGRRRPGPLRGAAGRAVASRDGTPVSMFLVHQRGTRRARRQRRRYLTGYGGFNISMTPAFSRSLLLWLEHGGVVAIPNLRGGGEYGEAWHQAGMLGKQAEQLRRLHRRGRVADPRAVHAARAAGGRPAAPTAGCWWGRC